MPQSNESVKILEWYHLYKNGVYGYIFTYVRNHPDAEDILQTVFLALLNLGNKTKKIKHPKSYIFRMARNEALRIIKSVNCENPTWRYAAVKGDPPAMVLLKK